MASAKPISRAYLQLGFAGTMLLIGSAVPLLLVHRGGRSNQAAALGYEVIAGTGLSLQLLIYLTNRHQRLLKPYLIAGLLVGLLLLALIS